MHSFIATPPDSHFPIQNLPYGVFQPKAGGPARVGVAIGDHVLDLTLLEQRGLLDAATVGGQRAFQEPRLNGFMALGRPAWRAVRARLTELLREDTPTLRDDQALRAQAFFPQRDVAMLLPCAIGDYTDFYSSRQHATNVGSMFRGPDNALMPNWLHIPIAYHGRASSIVVSGTDVRRPCGQTNPTEAPLPTFGPSKSMDFELELGFLVGPGNALGEPIAIASAADHIFGMVLVNDWSARDIQRWEYQPLGPFLAKNFATSISPWVLPLEALAPFRVAGPVQDPAPLPYLRGEANWTFDIELEVTLQSAKMNEPQRICTTNAKHLYWNICQQLAHHTVNGCNLCAGDLLASGTISGPTPDSFGSLLELAWKGTKPLQLSSGETRAFLQDGDRVSMTGYAQGDGYRVGFGEVTGKVLPAR
jgi:fumarylacetoacetase